MWFVHQLNVSDYCYLRYYDLSGIFDDNYISTSGNDTNNIMRCSFEEIVNILLSKIVYGESNYLKGVT